MRTLIKLLLFLLLVAVIALVIAALVLHYLPPPPPPPSAPSAPGTPPPGNSAPANPNSPATTSAALPPDAPPAGAAGSVEHDRWRTEPMDIRRDFKAFEVSFSGPHKVDGVSQNWAIPEWVAYQIDALRSPLGKSPARPAVWATDETLYKQRIAPSDASYSFSHEFRVEHPDSPELGYDRGHMCMKQIAFRRGVDTDAQSFTLLNACPQKHELNAGIWEDLEIKTERWADEYGTVWVVCGPILNGHKATHWLGQPGEVPVAIPDAFYKIVIRATTDPHRPAVLAFIFPQTSPNYHVLRRGGHDEFDLKPYLTTVAEVEKETGLQFLTVLPPTDRAQEESAQPTTLWP